MKLAWLISLCVGLLVGAPHDPPADAVAKLKAYFTYQSRIDLSNRSKEHFTVVNIANHVFFRQDDPPAGYDQASRPVYVYIRGNSIDVINCPAGGRWLKCIAEYSEIGEPNQARKLGDMKTFDFTLDIPQWKPSPDSELKQEITEFGGFLNPQAIYIRNFNLNDPEISVRVISAGGTERFLGCSFSPAARKHCSWHLFGQTPIPALRRQIMKRPYQLYPPVKSQRTGQIHHTDIPG